MFVTAAKQAVNWPTQYLSLKLFMKNRPSKVKFSLHFFLSMRLKYIYCLDRSIYLSFPVLMYLR